MNNQFNINRIVLLFKRFFNENLQKELTFWGIAIIVMMLMHMQIGSIVPFLLISGLIFAGNQFKMFGYTSNGMHYLMLPATHLEKLTVSIILSTVYFFVVFILCYIIGTFLGTHVINLLFDRSENVQFLLFEMEGMENSDYNIFKLMGTFTLVQSLFILGSIYFKRSAIGKTFLSVALVFMVFGILQLIMLKLLYGTVELPNHEFASININLAENSVFQMLLNIMKVGSFVIVPIFWITSYFRLTEKQV